MKSYNKIKNNLIIGIILSFLFVSCEDSSSGHYEISFDMRLNQDSNGYYHLTLDRNKWQTLHRVTGSVEDKKYTVESFWVEWESNLYWYLGDTLGYVVKRNFNDAGMYVSYDTVYVTNFSGMEVPTSNKISYSSSDGVFNNMIAPVKSMIGDTLKLTAYWYDGKKDFYIVLD